MVSRRTDASSPASGHMRFAPAPRAWPCARSPAPVLDEMSGLLAIGPKADSPCSTRLGPRCPSSCSPRRTALGRHSATGPTARRRPIAVNSDTRTAGEAFRSPARIRPRCASFIPAVRATCRIAWCGPSYARRDTRDEIRAARYARRDTHGGRACSRYATSTNRDTPERVAWVLPEVKTVPHIAIPRLRPWGLVDRGGLRW